MECNARRNMIMTNWHRSIIAVFMTIVLATGSVGVAVAGVQECRPKACCCMQHGHEDALHMRQNDTNSSCTGNAPCCRMEPVRKAQNIAALTSRAQLPEAKASFQAVVAGQQFAAQPTPSSARTFQHNGKPGAPLVPLYLETQMLLC